MAAKRYPLPRRFNAALSEKAYTQLRSLNRQYGYGNNYLLTVLLENLEQITNREALQQAFETFEAEFGAPAPAGLKNKQEKDSSKN